MQRLYKVLCHFYLVFNGILEKVLFCCIPSHSNINFDFLIQALALGGTFFQKCGIISGSIYDWTCKAKCKEKYSEELKVVIKKCRRGSELSTVESYIKGLENRLKYWQKDLDAVGVSNLSGVGD